jgi:glutamate formiminotransferase
MARKLVECVPNFSEGRRADVIERIGSAIRSIPGALVLDVEKDADHNRSVITFAAPPDTVMEAALAGVAVAVAEIDLTRHQGVHPRIGACDVLPFVPLEGVTLEDCKSLAVRAGEQIWKRFGVPVYLYEAAARRPERVNLENIRRGQFEGLRDEVKTSPDRAPDFGEAFLHPTAGATVVGARKFLIAYNIHLGTPDAAIAKNIAKGIRHSNGGFRHVKAMGVPLESRGVSQVSMNLTDFEATPIHRVFETVRSEAERHGVPVVGSEIVGLIPRKALEMTSDFYLRFENFRSDLVLENRVADALAEESGLGEYLAALAAPAPAPGGGSAAAAAAAMGAALGSMVARLSKLDPAPWEAERAWFTAAVERDAASYRAVVAAYKKPKDERATFVEEALKGATLVPLETAERAHAIRAPLEKLAASTPAKFGADVATAIALCAAALAGALANVRINLDSLTDVDFRAEVDARLAAIS